MCDAGMITLFMAWFCRLLWPFTDPGQRRELRSDLYVMF
jgi:hypothetical protein